MTIPASANSFATSPTRRMFSSRSAALRDKGSAWEGRRVGEAQVEGERGDCQINAILPGERYHVCV